MAYSNNHGHRPSLSPPYNWKPAAQRRLRALRSGVGSGTKALPLSYRAAAAAHSHCPLPRKLLIANRGEIAVRIARGAAELGVATVAIYSEEDAQSMHRSVADEAILIRSVADGAGGIAAYLDIEAVVAAAKQSGADTIHPGYGFLSENAGFVARCEAEGLAFAGPRSEVITLFGDKTAARNFAAECGVAVIRGSEKAVLDAAEASAAAASMRYPLMLKATHGGGGRGMRIVETAQELPAAFGEKYRRAQLTTPLVRLTGRKPPRATVGIRALLFGSRARIWQRRGVRGGVPSPRHKYTDRTPD
eukprot:COSAG01_NODE_3252_length_6351_cov_8.495681_5_plen_304_part_00